MRRRLRNVDRKKAPMVVSIVVLGVIVSYLGGLGWAPTRATLSISITNQTDQPVSNVTNPVYLIVPQRFNLTALPENTSNLKFMRLSGSTPQAPGYWHEIQIEIVYIAAYSTVSFKLENISPVAADYSDLTETDVSTFLGGVPANVSFSLQFIVLRYTPIGQLSIGSYSYSQSAAGAQTPYGLRERVYAHLLYYPLCCLVILILLGIVISAKSETVRRRYPFTTFLIASASLYLYVFVGSGPEVGSLLNPLQPESQHFLPILGPLLHASYFHITGNLPLFVLIGAASEYVACVGITNVGRNAPRFAVFFLLPLLVFSNGYGLSLVIEMLAVFLLTYAVVNRKTIARSSWMAGIVFVSGLALSVFYNWLVYFIQLVVSVMQGSLSPVFAFSNYTTILAIGHILGTICASGIGWLLCQAHGSEQRGWTAKINNLCYPVFHETGPTR